MISKFPSILLSMKRLFLHGTVRSFRIYPLVAIVSIFFTGIFSILRWTDAYRNYLELSNPSIQLLNPPKGIGVSPVSIQLKAMDLQSGICSLLVEGRQGDQKIPLLNLANLGAQASTEATIQIFGKESSLKGSRFVLTMKATDCSLWKNTRTQTIEFPVDFHHPDLKLLSTSPVKTGSAALLIYRAADETIKSTGVLTGNQFFPAYPARILDAAFDASDLFAVLFRVAPNQSPPVLVAEDSVGNASSLNLLSLAQPRIETKQEQTLTQEILRRSGGRLLQENDSRIQQYLTQGGETLSYETESSTPERAIEEWRIARRILKEIGEGDITRALGGERSLERFWLKPFIRIPGQTREPFHDITEYKTQGTSLSTERAPFLEISLAEGVDQARAMLGGQVLSEGNFGIYGNTIIIDHGFGLSTLYQGLDHFSVKEGDRIEVGDNIGTVRPLPGERQRHFFFQTRISTVPVDPTDWFDTNFFEKIIDRTILEARKSLGIEE